MRKAGPRKPKPVTKDRLHNAAMAYMGRFSTTGENLRQVLLRRIRRAEDMEPEAKAAMTAYIGELIERYQASGLLNDTAYVEGKVASMRRSGASARAIGMKLRAKGADSEEVATVLQDSDGTDGDAAWVFARRKRLGPYRPEDTRRDFRQKDMAAMGRAGFDYGTARAVIDAPASETER